MQSTESSLKRTLRTLARLNATMTSDLYMKLINSSPSQESDSLSCVQASRFTLSNRKTLGVDSLGKEVRTNSGF